MAIFTPFAFFGGISSPPVPPPPVDPDAQAFIDAVVLGGDTLTIPEKEAINNLVLDLKTYGLYYKMVFFYPLIGGTASAHKWNLINPVNTDAGFRITFNGGWTHSASGARADGVNAWGNTHFLPSVDVAAYSLTNDLGMGVYINLNTTGNYDLGAYQPSKGDWLVYVRNSSNLCLFDGFAGSAFISYTPVTDSSGHWINNKTTSTVVEGYKDGVRVVNQGSRTPMLPPNQTIAIAASNRIGAACCFSDRQYVTIHLGSALTTTEAADLYTTLTTYNTSLGRV